MTKTISVGELRQNPTTALRDAAAGESYDVTQHTRSSLDSCRRGAVLATRNTADFAGLESILTVVEL